MFDGQMMSMLVMACSSLVVNVKNNLVESDLERLSCFTKLAEMISGEHKTVKYVQHASAPVIPPPPPPLPSPHTVTYTLTHCRSL